MATASVMPYPAMVVGVLVIFDHGTVLVSVPLIVPAVIFPVTVMAVRFARLVMLFCAPADNAPLKVPAVIVPVTFKLPSVPTFVMFGWLAVASVPVIVVALTDPAVMLFVTVKLLRTPSCVIPAWVLDDSMPLNVPPVMVPVTVSVESVPS